MLNRNKKIFAFFFCVFLAFFAKLSFVSALETNYPTIFGISINDTTKLPEYAKYFFNLGIAIAAFIAVGAVAFGGIYWLVSFGKGKFTDEGKNWIKSGILGLMIVMCAYLIAYTINEDLVIFKFGDLSISLNNPLFNTNLGSDIKSVTYTEIPLGKTTETLLTRTTDCYAFDTLGNPIEGEKIKTDNKGEINGPTYLKHDRIDCLAQLADGAQKKAHLISELSYQIQALMEMCDCQKYGKCNDSCNGQCGDPTSCPGGSCVSKCKNGECKNNSSVPDCCPTDSGVANPKDTKKNLTVKELIEHGPITTSIADVCTCQQTVNTGGGGGTGGTGGTDTEMTDVEIEVSGPCEGGKSMTTCSDGTKSCNCPSSYYNKNSYLTAGLLSSNFLLAVKNICQTKNPNGIGYCVGSGLSCVNNICTYDPANDPSKLGAINSISSLKYAGLDEFRCPNPSNTEAPCSNIANYVEEKVQVDGKDITIINQNKWLSLNLIQQQTYFKEKIEKMKEKIQYDIDLLNSVRSNLSSCYLAVSYIDLLGEFETTDSQQKFIKTEKIFGDPETGDKVDASKYCKGFNYAYSSCYKKCNDLCPDTSDKAIELYQKCESCSNNRTAECLEKQQKCIQDAYNSRPCIYNAKDTSQKYSDCISSCRDDCQTECSKKYLLCSGEYALCQKKCAADSSCITTESDSCLIDSESFTQTAKSVTDSGNTKYSIDRAYLCKYGSNQYAGYLDCIEDSSKSYPEYSASYIYNNTDELKCSEPSSPANKSSSCYSSTNKNSSCKDLCPEVTKCPASSNCPDCPCDKIDGTLKFCIPKPLKDESVKNSQTTVPIKNVGEILTRKVSEYQIVGPECNEYSYNDDPLTFYCENSWWTNPNRDGLSDDPIATKRIAPAGREVPVGQTVDDAKKWAEGVIKEIDELAKSIQNIIDKASRAGKAKDTLPIQNYCKCDAKYENGEPICKSDCLYSENLEPVYGSDGTFIGNQLKCSCSFVPCNGNPCKQVIDYLAEVWGTYKQMKTSYVDAFIKTLTEPRSDILKELTYSRQKVNECSQIKSSYGTAAKLMSCTRVEDELISPVNTSTIKFNGKYMSGYCYGTSLGKLFNESVTDNWFCAEEWKKK